MINSRIGLVIFFLVSVITFSNCNKHNKKKPIVAEDIEVIKDSVVFSFSFVGCNRVQYGDWHNDSATNASTANLSVLKRIFDDMTGLTQKPSLFFFLGDLVLAESDTTNLNAQLKAWVELYKDKAFSEFSNSGIELVAVPGNHEMLFYNTKDSKEYPLAGATPVWMKYMKPYMPADRNYIMGTDSVVNQMTFSFKRHNVGFVVMNTDTYNPPTSGKMYGFEGLIPTQWIVNQIEQFKDNPDIDHIFVLGHKPYYVDGKPETGHKGFPEGPILWPQLQKNKVIAMLSAHVHDYQRMQPDTTGTYQIIAGNGGSKGPAAFFGYSMINIMSSGKVQFVSRGFDKGTPYYQDVPGNPIKIQDSTTLTWSANANPYQGN
ncbi:metallophosphoesterase family protein [Aquimarina sp. 2201CG14-23]|uniref:metallophosphoesterase family protein n=1 Tax=Aquimarina mycalae TaxID=3040073 RepID=UPI0024782198|nr:metallophosphoesterase [Aquimarina sp. 2201CG14-23]MDH7445624.1 metallophosphoesterase [Aquimarina sp. 2201CG14-23]